MPAYRFSETYIDTPDGEKLLTRTVFPLSYTDGMKMPVVIHRTPYEAPVNNWPFDSTTLGRVATDFLDRGYIYVNQHCRGTGSSTGVFRNMKFEREDGLTTLDWVREQKWFNHEIFLYGNSYKSFVHTMIIGLNPPDVKGAALAVMPANVRDICYEKNTFKHDLYTLWFSKTFMVNQIDKTSVNKKMVAEIRNRPFIKLAQRVYGFEVPELTDLFVHGNADDPMWTDSYTSYGQANAAPLETKIPVLLVGGLYDIHFNGTVEYFRAIPKPMRDKCALFMGPWTHSMATLPEHKPLFPGSSHPPVEAEWFDHIRLGEPLHYVTEGNVTYYTPGKGWVRNSDFGMSSSGQLVLHPSEGGKLASEASEGSLSYNYDPGDPLELPGGANCFQTSLRGPQPQPEPGFRQDLLSFISEPFEKPVLADGKVDVKLEISSDCPDTAFFVRVDVVRKDVAWCLRDTIVSVSDIIKDYIPGSRETLDFKLDEVVWTFQPGDRIRIDVSSSNFPTYNAHSNTAEPWYEATEIKTARNTVFMEGTFFTFPTVS